MGHYPMAHTVCKGGQEGHDDKAYAKEKRAQNKNTLGGIVRLRRNELGQEGQQEQNHFGIKDIGQECLTQKP